MAVHDSTTIPDSKRISLTVKDIRPGEDNNSWDVDVKCLLCNTLIEAAVKETAEEPIEAPEPVAEAAGGIAATSTEAATPEPDVDSVVGNDDDADMKSEEPPTSDTAAPDPVPKAIPNGETTVEISPNSH